MPEPNNTDSKIFEQSGYGQFVCFYKQIYLWIHRMNVSQWGGGGGGGGGAGYSHFFFIHRLGPSI